MAKPNNLMGRLEVVSGRGPEGDSKPRFHADLAPWRGSLIG